MRVQLSSWVGWIWNTHTHTHTHICMYAYCNAKASSLHGYFCSHAPGGQLAWLYTEAHCRYNGVLAYQQCLAMGY